MMEIQNKIHKKLEYYSDGKKLKGDELVGWLGEIYGKLFLDGELVPDSYEHDFITRDGKRISVKARKSGRSNNWYRTSAIPKITGECPTHLMFIHLNNDYSINKIWLYPWEDLIEKGRFKKHIVRGHLRSYYFRVRPVKDEEYLIYPTANGA